MNKKLVFVLTIIFVLSFAIFALAAQDFRVILDPIGDQEYSSLPQTYDVTGTVTGDENTKINWIKLYINDHEEYSLLLGDKKIGKDGYKFSLPWDIEDKGLFDVKVITEIEHNGGITRQDTESNVRITLTSNKEFGVVLDPIGNQKYSSFPQTYDVTGTITGDENTKINWIKLYINGNLEDSIYNKKIGKDGYDFSLPWDIENEGSFEVKVIAEIEENGGITKQDKENNVKIMLISKDENNEQATGSNPAAPAVANKILKELGIKHNYGDGNYIADVAREMGPGTEFQGVDKNSAGYKDKIEAYLDDHETWNEDKGIQNDKPGNGEGHAYGLNKEKNNNAAEKGSKKNK